MSIGFQSVIASDILCVCTFDSDDVWRASFILRVFDVVERSRIVACRIRIPMALRLYSVGGPGVCACIMNDMDDVRCCRVQRSGRQQLAVFFLTALVWPMWNESGPKAVHSLIASVTQRCRM